MKLCGGNIATPDHRGERDTGVVRGTDDVGSLVWSGVVAVNEIEIATVGNTVK